MGGMKTMKEQSFHWPHHSVDLVERVMEINDDCVVCVARSESKTFIVFKVFQEVWRRNMKCGKMVLLVDDEKAAIVKPFLTGISNQGLLLVKTCLDESVVMDGEDCFLSSCDIMVITGEVFARMLKAGILDLLSFSLVIFDKCDLALDKEHHFAFILKQVERCKLDSRPQIVGLTSDILLHQECPEDMETFLITLEQMLHCKTLVSSDLLALNRYGEYSDVEISSFTCHHVQDQLISKLSGIFVGALLFLRDYRVNEVMETCVTFVKHILSESHQVLQLLGWWCTTYVAKIIIKEIDKLEKRCTKDGTLLILQFCRTQMNLIISISEQEKLEISEDSLTDLATILLSRMSGHLMPEHHEVSASQTTSSTDQPICGNLTQSSDADLIENASTGQSQHNGQVPNQSLKSQASYGTKRQCNDPLCVVLVPSTIIAKALNSLINKLSNSTPKYSFLRSASIHGDKEKQGKTESSFSDEMEDNVMVCVQDGSVNVLVATFEVEQELYAKRCSLLIRLGLPSAYENYFRVKSKLKSAGGKLVILVRDEEMATTEDKHKIFQRIEKLLKERCPNSRPPGYETRRLFQDDHLEVYKPLGEGGPSVDLLSSISLVNSYCSKFPSGGEGAPVPVCKRREVWSDKEVEFVSMLYLPRNSPVYQPIKGSVTLKRSDVNEETARKARVKSEMLAALEACRLLHEKGELNEDLEPVFRLSILSLTAQHEPCDCEVADGGIGMDGTVQRHRAYIRKFPSLLENNFPVCGEPSYVYSINLELTKPWTFDRAVRSQSKAQSTADHYCLGILSRKPLPKLPCMVIFDRAGEVTATVSECSPHPVVLTSTQLSLLQRFTGYIFREIARPKRDSSATFPSFDPAIASSGYYISLLNNASGSSSRLFNSQHNHKSIAFDFMASLESELGSFDNPFDPPPPDVTAPEIFRDAVVTAIYSGKRSHYYVADICYDRSPADPFPNPEVASTFAEYYKIRYAVEVSLDQPMLDVDHTSSRLNFLLPRYQNAKGQHLVLPGKDSKRSKRSEVFIIPELCSIHPVPGYLWRQLFNLPAVLYRVESLLVAEELRCRVLRDLGIGAVDWPRDVPLPLLAVGEMMGEEIVPVTHSSAEESNYKSSSEMAEEYLNASLSIGLPKALMDLEISRQEEWSETFLAKNLSLEPSNDDVSTPCVSAICENSHVEHSCSGTKHKPHSLPAPFQGSFTLNKGEVHFPQNKLSNTDVEPTSGDNVRPAGDAESKVSAVSIWTDPLLSSLYQTCGPSSTLILRALTSTVAGDVFSLERLEMLGDSFVKYAITSSIFFKHRYENEGVLSFLRGIKVSNRQLFYLARQRGVPSYMFTRMFNPLVNWLPPGFYHEDDSDSRNGHLSLIPDKGPEELDDDEEDGSIFAGMESSVADGDPHGQCPSEKGQSSNFKLNSYLHLCCSDKSIADTTEALIGAFLLCFGPEGAFRFLEWLGAELTRQQEAQDEDFANQSPSDFAHSAVLVESPSTENSQETFQRYHQACRSLEDPVFQSDETNVPISSINGLLSGHSSTASEFKPLEEALSYSFRDKSLLLQAFTHSSLPRDHNSIRSSYEQLEFLGDALLDFLVTRHLYIHHRHMSPGELTDLRSAVVNNYSFAVLAVKLGFPRHLRSLSLQLFGTVNRFMVKLKEKERKHATTQQGKDGEIYSSVFVMGSEGKEDSIQVEVPKALGDLFEAVAGAVYVDCGEDLDRVWQVYLPILKPSIDYYSAHPPMSAIRRLLEMMPNAAKFSPVERMVDGKFKCTLTVSGCGTFVATGRNFRIAKSTAAQKALSALQRRDSAT